MRIITVILLWGMLAAQANSHDAGGWQYPSYCCHGADCAVVEWQGENKQGEGIASTNIHGGVSIDPKRYYYRFISPDGRMHICATPDTLLTPPDYVRRYYCIYAPAGM